MKSQLFASRPAFRRILALAALFGFIAGGAFSTAADYSEFEVDWQFKSGLDKAAFGNAFSTLTKQGYRIVDLESYRMGRSSTVSTVWTKLGAKEGWRIEMSLPIAKFLEAHEKHLENGYALVEVEVDRNGATLHFSGVWLKGEDPLDTEFHFGMESLEFSNRYGEMADRGYRLVDFEAYEANGKFRHVGIWVKNEGHEVRFYRAIEKNRFGEVAAMMEDAGFRLLDVEGYVYERDFVFAGSWVRSAEWQESKYAFDLLADEFYNRNASYTQDGFRLTEFETYEDNGALYYAGSWLKGNPANYTKKTSDDSSKKKASLSLEAFRSGEN